MANPNTRARPLSIGEFGRLSGLSAKALRLYDVGGLLVPADVDPITGYRRYAPDQLDRARRISLLRQLDMPLSLISEVLAGTDEQAAQRLDRWWAGQEAVLRDRRGSYEYLRAQLVRDGTRWTPHPVELTRLPATTLASIRRDVDQAALVGAIVEAEHEVRDALRTAGVTGSGESWVIYHSLVAPDTEGQVEIAIPYPGAAHPTMQPTGRVGIRIEPAHTVAACTISRAECSYPLIMLAYQDVADALPGLGVTVAGAPREVYLAGADCTDPAGPYARIALPVSRPA